MLWIILIGLLVVVLLKSSWRTKLWQGIKWIITNPFIWIGYLLWYLWRCGTSCCRWSAWGVVNMVMALGSLVLIVKNLFKR